MKEKLVSIIVSFYNEERFLREAIQSVLDSSYENIELILIDDGSTDRSEEVVKSFSDSRIRYTRLEKNQGQGHGRNIGMDMAFGEYIGFFDGDDLLDNSKIRKQVNYLEQNPETVLISGGYSTIDIDGKIIEKNIKPLAKTNEEIKAYMLFKNVIACGGVLFRKSIISDHHIRMDEKIRSSEDYKFFIDCLKCGKVENVDENLMFYRRGDSRYVSQTAKMMEKNKKQYDKDMVGIFLHAWTERGFDISSRDALFIYKHFYGTKRFNRVDIIRSRILKENIRKQLIGLNLLEGDKIIEYYNMIEKRRIH